MDYRLKFSLAILLVINDNGPLWGMEKSFQIKPITSDEPKEGLSDFNKKSLNQEHIDDAATDMSSSLPATIIAVSMRPNQPNAPEGSILRPPSIDSNRADTATMPAGATGSDWWWQNSVENPGAKRPKLSSDEESQEDFFPGQQRK